MEIDTNFLFVCILFRLRPAVILLIVLKVEAERFVPKEISFPPFCHDSICFSIFTFWKDSAFEYVLYCFACITSFECLFFIDSCSKRIR